MNFKEDAKCHLSDERWTRQEQAKCDATYDDREMNKFCHEVVNRELKRRKDVC